MENYLDLQSEVAGEGYGEEFHVIAGAYIMKESIERYDSPKLGIGLAAAGGVGKEIFDMHTRYHFDPLDVAYWVLGSYICLQFYKNAQKNPDIHKEELDEEFLSMVDEPRLEIEYSDIAQDVEG